MAFTISGTTGINLATQPLTGALPDANAPSGSVLQVVNGLTTATFSTSSTTYVTTGHSATITPSSASSKILILYSGTWCIQGANTEIDVTVRNNLSSSNLGFTGFYSATASGYTCTTLSFNYLDSPASTSALTYTVYAKEAGVPGTVSSGTEPKSLTLVEIAG